MVKVFISSAYSQGDVETNIMRQIRVSDMLMDMGFAPLAQLVEAHVHNKHYPRSYEHWLKFTTEWVPVCDCILRLDGKSEGADKEVELAKSLNKPVFYTIESLYEHYKLNK